MITSENQHLPGRTFFIAISLPLINATVCYIVSTLYFSFFYEYAYDANGPFLLAIILIVLSLIPSLIMALAVTFKFKPINFSANQNALIWTLMGAFTALLIGFFTSGLDDNQGWFTNGTGWIVLSNSIVGLFAGRYLVQSKSTMPLPN